MILASVYIGANTPRDDRRGASSSWPGCWPSVSSEWLAPVVRRSGRDLLVRMPRLARRSGLAMRGHAWVALLADVRRRVVAHAVALGGLAYPPRGQIPIPAASYRTDRLTRSSHRSRRILAGFAEDGRQVRHGEFEVDPIQGFVVRHHVRNLAAQVMPRRWRRAVTQGRRTGFRRHAIGRASRLSIGESPPAARPLNDRHWRCASVGCGLHDRYDLGGLVGYAPWPNRGCSSTFNAKKSQS